MVDLPSTASLLQGDIPLDDLARSLSLPRDLVACEGGSGLRPLFEAIVRQTAMEGKLRSTQALLDEEVRRSAGLSETLGLREKAHAVEVRKYVVELKKLKEDLALTVPRYRESEAFQKDVEDYVALHMEDLVTRWFATEAGRERIAAEGLLMYDVGQYAMQRDIYTALGRRDATFDPLAWGLPAKLANPDPAASAESAEPVGSCG